MYAYIPSVYNCMSLFFSSLCEDANLYTLFFFFIYFIAYLSLKLLVLAAAPDIFYIPPVLPWIKYFLLSILWLLIILLTVSLYTSFTSSIIFFSRVLTYVVSCLPPTIFYMLHTFSFLYSLKILSSLQLQTSNYTANTLSR